ncbi:MAG: hypothetical protein ACFB2W_02950 [Leptolyngbyaceae cyanobacterium]
MARPSRKKRKKPFFKPRPHSQSSNTITAREALCAVLAGLGIGIIAMASAVLFFSSSLLRVAIAITIFGLRTYRLLMAALKRNAPMRPAYRYVKTKLLNEELWRYFLDSRLHWKDRDCYRPWRIQFNSFCFLLGAVFAAMVETLQSSSRISL